MILWRGEQESVWAATKVVVAPPSDVGNARIDYQKWPIIIPN